jgi:hypothetical protein
MGPRGSPETSVRNYHCTLRKYQKSADLMQILYISVVSKYMNCVTLSNDIILPCIVIFLQSGHELSVCFISIYL